MVHLDVLVFHLILCFLLTCSISPRNVTKPRGPNLLLCHRRTEYLGSVVFFRWNPDLKGLRFGPLSFRRVLRVRRGSTLT